MGERSNDTAGEAKSGVSRNLLALVPLLLFLALAAVFLVQLNAGGGNQDIPSVLIGKPAPAMALAPLEGLNRDGQALPGFVSADLTGKPHVVNVWASWCVPCRAEHPFIEALGRDERIMLVGLNYKDKTANALRFLGQLGNPFDAVGVDTRGKAAIEWGVYGVPETFIVDAKGMVRYKHIGPLTEDSYREKFLPQLEAALAGDG